MIYCTTILFIFNDSSFLMGFKRVLRELKKNIIYNALYQALVILLPILTMPYLVRTLSKEQIGINSYSLSVVQILCFIITKEL